MRERARSTPTSPEKKSRDVELADNRRARFDYAIEERVEAGLSLTGTEIKSLRAGHANLRDGYAKVEKGEAWLRGAGDLTSLGRGGGADRDFLQEHRRDHRERHDGRCVEEDLVDGRRERRPHRGEDLVDHRLQGRRDRRAQSGDLGRVEDGLWARPRWQAREQ